MKGEDVLQADAKVSEGSWGQAVWGSGRFPILRAYWLHEAVNVKHIHMKSPRCWRCQTHAMSPQKIGDESGWPNKETSCAPGRRDGGAGLLKAFETQMISSQVSDAGPRNEGFVLPCWILVLFPSNFSLLSPFPLLWTGDVYSLPVYIRTTWLILYFIGSHS